jgi:c-di-GMP phosphodiesterase
MQEILIPLSVAMAILCGAVSIWLLSRPRSPRAALAEAVHNRQFVIHYQPIIELATRRCIGAEALVRLRGADGSLIRPDLFIAYAEDTGLIGSITRLVVELVVEELGDLLRRDRAMHVAINLSGSDIVSGSILQVLDQALGNTDIAAQQVWLEATERSFINTEGARTTLAELQRRGHRTVIDDFGTGYSSLKYLKDLPIDTLKIDKAFIETVGTAAPTSNVTGHIIAMARELNLSLVAEGVETEAQSTFLIEHNVRFAQGWLFARAVPIHAFLDFYGRNRAEYGTPAAEPTTAQSPGGSAMTSPPEPLVNGPTRAAQRQGAS